MASGVDTLEATCSVVLDGPDLVEWLVEAKARAEDQGTPWMDEDFSVAPRGTKNGYSYRLQFAWGEVALRAAKAGTDTLECWVKFYAESLWILGEWDCEMMFRQVMQGLGGCVLELKPSRVDLCADFYMPGGLDEGLLRRSLTTRVKSTRAYHNSNKLETFYVGAGSAPLQLRIYDKGKQMAASGKDFMLSKWGRDEPTDVWRFELQVRREFLRERGVEVMADLRDAGGEIWRYGTTEFASFRDRTCSDHVERCPSLPFWDAVQRGGQFGEPFWHSDQVVRRSYDLDQIVAQIDGLLKTVAAVAGRRTTWGALEFVKEELVKRRSEAAFRDAVHQRKLELGVVPFGRRY